MPAIFLPLNDAPAGRFGHEIQKKNKGLPVAIFVATKCTKVHENTSHG